MKTILVDAWNTFVTEDGMNHEMYTMLEGFPNRKIVLTNANEEEREKMGIVDMPYEVFSCDHNPDKIDPGYYKKLLEKYGFSSEDVVYFEHNPAHVESAVSHDIKTFHYDKERKDIEEVKRFLEMNI